MKHIASLTVGVLLLCTPAHVVYAVQGSQRVVEGQSVSEAVYYTVKRGDTLSGIAKKYGMTLDQILKLNPDIKDPNKIYPGQQILIKEGSQNSSKASQKPSWEKTADAVIAEAKKHIGPNYKYGANGPDKFDCSGLVQYSFKKAAGIKLPRSSKEQAEAGTSVSFKNLRKGDIVYFGDKNMSHVGIYIGNQQFIHAANSEKGIIISDINNSYWRQHFVNGSRVIK